MRLKVVLPDRTLIDRAVDKLVAESVHGSFCMKPRHADYVAPIVPGVLSYEADGEEHFVGAGAGVAVKAGEEVLVAIRDAVTGAELGRIRQAVRERLGQLAAGEDRARVVARRLESELARRFAELREEPGGAS